MLPKTSLLLLAALTAGSAVARLHGHERRHAHEAADKRAVGDVVYATIDGQLVSWINEWSGVPATTTTTAAAAAAAAPTAATEVTVPAAPAAPNPAPAATTDTPAAAAAPAAPAAAVDWTASPANGQFSTQGFGGRTSPSGSGINYAGNVGIPWGSNIIEVAPAVASQYQYVAKVVGSNTDVWTVVFWNKIGPDGKLDGWYGHSALTLTLQPGEVKYVAFDSNSQGAWGAAKGTSLPTDQWGGYSCTWGEFDFGDENNNGWSGWDVSAIQAQAASQEVQGMKICDHLGTGCSWITNAAAEIVNAYTFVERFLDGLGGNSGSQAVRLEVHIDYN